MQPRLATLSSPTQRGCVCVNGRVFAPGEARVSALDAGFLLGDGLFESLRAVGGAPYLLDRHIARLLAAAGQMAFAGCPSPPELFEQVRRTVERSGLSDAYVRITITRGESLAPLTAPSGPSTVVIAALPAPAPRSGGLHAALIAAPAEQGAAAKSTSRQHAVLARSVVERRGAQEGLYVTGARHVSEGISSNLFALLAGVLVTPPADRCLPGITRGRLLELARGAGMAVAEQPVAADTLFAADAVFATNAVGGLRPICAIDGRSIGAGDPDERFLALLDLYESDRRTDAGQGREPGRGRGADCA